MDSENRMDGCVCANGAKVAEIVHPYCPAHVPPEMEEATEATRRDLAGWMATSDKLWAENASLRAEVERLKAELKQARKDRDREALDRQTAGDAWNDMRRQRDTALADLARVTPSAEVITAIGRALSMASEWCVPDDDRGAPAERLREEDEETARAWLASLPGGDKEPGGFCACGRRASECDRSRKACTSSVAP